MSLAKAIEILDCQVVITAIEENVLAPFLSSLTDKSNDDSMDKYKMFHVKQGEVVER